MPIEIPREGTTHTEHDTGPPSSGLPALLAGDFATWMAEIDDAIRYGHPSDVPCGDCTACCTSSQFIHIGPDEQETLSLIPARLLFPAPGLPRGHLLLGYDDRGRCPMLVDNRCSIYELRPRTCRSYDCRIFAASGLAADHDQVQIGRQAQRWRFSFRTPADQKRCEAVRAAATFLRETSDPAQGTTSPGTTRLALMALRVHHRFLPPGS